MTREFVTDLDHRWVMRCDLKGCTARSEPFTRQPDLALFPSRGWFIARVWGDRCPTHRDTADSTPHAVMGADA